MSKHASAYVLLVSWLLWSAWFLVAAGPQTSLGGHLSGPPSSARLVATSAVSGGYVARSGTNLVYSPDASNRCWLYVNSAWRSTDIPDAGVTVACSPTSPAIVGDGYVYIADSDSDGDIDTMNVTSTAPTTQNGIAVCDGYPQYLVVARVYGNAAGGIDCYNADATATPGRSNNLCNYYNRRELSVVVSEGTSHTNAAGAWQFWRNSASGTYMVSWVQAVPGAVSVTLNGYIGIASGGHPYVSWVYDTSTAGSSIPSFQMYGVTGFGSTLSGSAQAVFAAGRHYGQPTEYSNASDNFYSASLMIRAEM